MKKILFVCHGRISVRTSRPSSAGLPLPTSEAIVDQDTWNIAHKLRLRKTQSSQRDLVEELQDQASIAQCEENECHFKIGFSAGQLVQQEAVEQMKEMGTTG